MSKWLKYSLSIGFFVLVGGTFFAPTTKAAPLCYNTGNSLGSPTSQFPRSGQSKISTFGCADTPASTAAVNCGVNGCDTNGGHILLSSYYATGTGSPGSTLHTPNASVNVYTTNPGAVNIVTVNVYWCRGGSTAVVNSNINGGGFQAATTSFTFGGVGGAASQFRRITPISSVYIANSPVFSRVPANLSMICKISYSSPTPGTSISFNHDALPEDNTRGPAPDRYNQVNWPTRSIIGPSYGVGAIALRADYDATLEYSASFAPDCTVTTNRTIFLKVYDADAPGANPPGTQNPVGPEGDGYPRMLVHEYDQNGNYVQTLNPTGDGLNRVFVQNDSYASYAMTARAGYKYSWVWWNVYARNGLQIWSPYSDELLVPGAGNCIPPNNAPAASITASCVLVGSTPILTVTYSASDPDNNPMDITITGPAPIGTRTETIGSAVAGRAAPGSPYTWGGPYAVGQTVNLSVSDRTAPPTPASFVFSCPRPPPTIFCSPALFVPGAVLEPGDTWSPRIGIEHRGPAGADNVNMTVTFSVSGLAGSTRTSNFILANSSPAITTAIPGVGGPPVTHPTVPNTPITLPAAQDYIGNVTISYVSTSGLPGNCNGGAAYTVLIRVVNRPYFKVLGGDLINYGTTTRGYNQQGATYTSPVVCATAILCGAGVEGANQTNGTIEGVPSAYKRATFGGLKGLTYANTPGGVYASWGGGFGAGAPALSYIIPPGATNYTNFAAIPANANTEYQTVSPNLSGGTVPPGARVTLYATGNIRIMNNITYAGSGGYANRDAIPHFRLVATGNIYIDPSVQQLDGEYIALGQVYTCHNAVWPVPISGVNINGPCAGSTLIVNGGLVGDSIKLTRTTGTRRNAQVTDGQTGGCAAPTALSRGYCNTTNIGEIIQFSPELFVAKPATSPTNTPISGQYNSITSLPPLF